MKYPINYIKTRDIDWFFHINNICFHVASAAGNLPDEVNDKYELKKLQHQISHLDKLNEEKDIVINEEMLKRILGNATNYAEKRAYYLSSFLEMSKKGFVAIDKSYIDDPDDNEYHIVCFPRNLYNPNNGKGNLLVPELKKTGHYIIFEKDDTKRDIGQTLYPIYLSFLYKDPLIEKIYSLLGQVRIFFK